MSRFSEAAPTRLDDLEAFLASDPAREAGKWLSDLDGYLTAIAIGPELIMPSEWLPRILGETAPEFLSEEQAMAVLDAVMGHFNGIIRQLREDPDGYRPMFWENEHGQVIVDDWVEGFLDGVALRGRGWQVLLNSTEYRDYFAPIAVRMTDAEGRRPLMEQGSVEDRETVRNLIDRAAELIPESVVEMDRFFKQSRRFSAGGAKLGRNDPCFCGSGKKFKKCCGRH